MVYCQGFKPAGTLKTDLERLMAEQGLVELELGPDAFLGKLGETHISGLDIKTQLLPLGNRYPPALLVALSDTRRDNPEYHAQGYIIISPWAPSVLFRMTWALKASVDGEKAEIWGVPRLTLQKGSIISGGAWLYDQASSLEFLLQGIGYAPVRLEVPGGELVSSTLLRRSARSQIVTAEHHPTLWYPRDARNDALRILRELDPERARKMHYLEVGEPTDSGG